MEKLDNDTAWIRNNGQTRRQKQKRKRKFPTFRSNEKMSICHSDEAEADTMPPTMSALIYPDVLALHPDHPAEAFFELANSKRVGYRCYRYRSGVGENDDDEEEEIVVEVDQDPFCLKHTGGIVWETSYLLATYLLQKRRRRPASPSKDKGEAGFFSLGRTMEVGAGCGLLGLVLASASVGGGLCDGPIIMTEAEEAMTNLEHNVKFYQERWKEEGKSKPPHLGSDSTVKELNKHFPKVVAKRLRWDHLEEDVKAKTHRAENECSVENDNYLLPHSFDTIVGTDVLFSVALVIPLLCTLHRMAKFSNHTTVYLCLQERCEDAYALLWKKAPFYFETVQEDTPTLETTVGCKWALDMDCKLICLRNPKREVLRGKVSHQVLNEIVKVKDGMDNR